MDLKTYLKKHDIPASWVAERAKVACATIHNILKGKDVLLSVALKVEGATGGDVKCKDMLPTKVFNRKKPSSISKIEVDDEPKAKKQKNHKKVA